MILQHPQLFKLLYRIRNWRAHWRAFWYGASVELPRAIARKFATRIPAEGNLVLRSRLCATLIFKDGRAPLDLGCIAKRVVTTAFVNYLRDDLANAAGGADISTFKYHASGTGVEC
jgi:hypothetical protein